MKVAIIGAGFAGVATCWHLLRLHPKASVTVFDARGVGEGASATSAGLLHPFSGLDAKLSWKGREGWLATYELLNIASKTLGQPVFTHQGLLRIALSERQRESFEQRSREHDDVRWCPADECQRLVAGLVSAPGIFIDCGIAVLSETYLKGLWKACENVGAHFQNKAINDLDELRKEHDVIIVAAGANSGYLPELSHLRLNAVKGQILELQWPSDIPPLPFPINSQAYIVMTGPHTCIAGATFEKAFGSSDVDHKIAEAEIRPKIEALLPALKNAPLIGCRAGIRATTPDHLPLVKQVDDKIWVFTGLGSKGLLYHSLFAAQLVSDMRR